MKRHTIFIIMIMVLLCCAMSAAGEKTINPKTDVVFTCGSNPEDFNGKTFENLYVLLKGCTDLRSTIIPEDNVFVTLRDITVKGTMYYVDDKYDTVNNIYTEAKIGENETYADHWLNIAGDSEIKKMELSCVNPHICNLGLQFPSYVDNMYVYPSNSLSKGKIVLRGYIDPLVDNTTDYYNDQQITAYPDFNYSYFDNEFGNTAIISEMNMKNIGTLDMMYYSLCTEFGRVKTINSLPELFSPFLSAIGIDNEIKDESKNIYSLFRRGHINNLYIFNNFEQSVGETYIDLANLSCDRAYVSNSISNNVTDFESNNKTFELNWIPVLESVGYTNIGLVSVYSDIKTTVLDTKPYKANSQTLEFSVPPLFIDVMVVGTEGKQVNVDIELTKIVMMNYLGGISDGSIINLTTSDKRVSKSVNHTEIGTLTINGGSLNFLSENMIAKNPTIKKLYLLPGRDDFRFINIGNTLEIDATSINNISNILQTIEKGDFIDEAKSNPVFESESFLLKNGFYNTYKTSSGFIWAEMVYNLYMGRTPENITSKNNTFVNLKNVSLGDINVDYALGPNCFSGSCNFFQWGQPEGKIDTINIF